VDSGIHPFQFGKAFEARILKATTIYIERFQDKMQ